MPSHRRRGVTAGRRLGPYRAPKPYRGLFNPPYNATTPLSIPSPIAGANAMHPDVIDFGASGWHGYRYWMSHTPYNLDGNTEVPCIVATNDITNGGTWVVPTGYTNPITPDPAAVEAHMADSDIVYDASSDRLYVFYISEDDARTTAEGAPVPAFQNVRSKWTAGDGTWSAEVNVVLGPKGSLANPSIIKTATGWRMYYTNGLFTLCYRDTTSTPDSGYGAEVQRPMTLNFGQGDRIWQNINVVKDTDGTIVVLISDANTTTFDGKFYMARSTDSGDTFSITGPPILELGDANLVGVSNFDSGGIYRASILVDTNSQVVTTGSNVHLFYTGYQPNFTDWGIGYTQIPAAFMRL